MLNYLEESFSLFWGGGGYPGVVSSFARDPYFGQGEVSEKNWLALGVKNKRRYDYSYFDTLLEIPSENTIDNGIFPSVLNGNKINEVSITNSEIWKIKGDLEVNNLSDSLGVKIFLVQGVVKIKKDLKSSNTFPVFISNGSIEIEPQVHQIEGILISDGRIKTGKIKEENNLKIKGMAISWQEFLLERERDNISEPTEFFSYNPELLLKISPFLGRKRHLWEELIP